MVEWEQPTIEKLAEQAEYRRQLGERLTAFSEKFIEIRTAMGIGPEVGLGSLIRCHQMYTTGTVTNFRRDSDGTLTYDTPRIPFGVLPVELLPEDLIYIVVMPEERDKPVKLVSVYQQIVSPLPVFDLESMKLVFPTYSPDWRFIQVDNIVLEGLTAHELAHVLVDGNYPLMDRVQEVLQRRKAEASAMLESDVQRYYLEFDGTNHSEIDIIAALMGYREQVIAQLQYVIDCISSYPLQENVGRSMFRSPQMVIAELRIRIAEVQRYCR